MKIPMQVELYQRKFENWYYKKEFYFEQFFSLMQENLTVYEYICRHQEL